MSKKVVVIVIFILSLLALSSCASKGENPADKMPGVEIPLGEMNTKVTLGTYQGMPQVHKTGETLVFVIKNLSSDTIAFGQDFGVRIFKKQDAAWVPVDNQWAYTPGENNLSPDVANPMGLAFFAKPDMGGLKSATTVRVVVVGVTTSSPAAQVGAYLDVQYNP